MGFVSGIQKRISAGFVKKRILLEFWHNFEWTCFFFLEYIETFYLLGQNEAWVNEKLKLTLYHMKWFRFWREGKAITSLYTATFYGFVIIRSIET